MAFKQVEIIYLFNVLQNVSQVGSFIKDETISMQKQYLQIVEVRWIGNLDFYLKSHIMKSANLANLTN